MIARKTGISSTRLSELCNKSSAQLRVKELYAIAVAIQAPPGEMFEWIGDRTERIARNENRDGIIVMIPN